MQFQIAVTSKMSMFFSFSWVIVVLYPVCVLHGICFSSIVLLWFWYVECAKRFFWEIILCICVIFLWKSLTCNVWLCRHNNMEKSSLFNKEKLSNFSRLILVDARAHWLQITDSLATQKRHGHIYICTRSSKHGLLHFYTLRRPSNLRRTSPRVTIPVDSVL